MGGVGGVERKERVERAHVGSLLLLCFAWFQSWCRLSLVLGYRAAQAAQLGALRRSCKGHVISIWPSGLGAAQSMIPRDGQCRGVRWNRTRAGVLANLRRPILKRESGPAGAGRASCRNARYKIDACCGTGGCWWRPQGP